MKIDKEMAELAATAFANNMADKLDHEAAAHALRCHCDLVEALELLVPRDAYQFVNQWLCEQDGATVDVSEYAFALEALARAKGEQ